MEYLKIENLYKNFGKTEVLKGIDLTLNKGEVVSIIGSSGSGKTTLLRCINFLERADGGRISLDGEEIFNASETSFDNAEYLRQKRLNFGLVFQSFNLFPQYSVKRNITLAPELLVKQELKALKKQLKQEKQPRKVIKQALKNALLNSKETIEKEANELIEKTGLNEKIHAYPCELSGGQCQRVAIARALALKPKILCFDEPTSALDPELTGEVLKVIKSLRDEGRTMIIVTHEMGFAKNVSDKIVYMADGIIEEVGTPKQVFENPKSEKLKAFLSSVSNKENE